MVHTPDMTPRDSLYFDYRVHPFVPPPELAGRPVRHPVAIVGGGPVGLATALDLARFGVGSVVIEADAQVSEGSRAVCLARRSLEILQQLDLDRRFLEKGLPWTTGRSFYKGRLVYRLAMPHDPDDRFAPMTNLQQNYMETYLLERIAETDLIEVRWASKVVGVAQTDAKVDLTIDTPDGEYRLEADWVVAADGARSPMRRLMGLRLEGDAYEGRFVIADIKLALDHPIERRAYFDPPWNPGNTVLFHKEPDDIWRVDYRLPDDESPDQALRPENLEARIQAHLDMLGIDLPWRLDWCSIYSANTLTLADYVHGRVAFTGDAAHLLPIFGVRGLNTGWQDSNNLAWKLAFTVRGWSDAAILATYSEERVAAAREICAEAAKSTRFMTPPTRGYRLMRDATLSLALSQPFPRELLNWRTSRPHDYPAGPLNRFPEADAAFRTGPGVGAPLANVRLGADAYLFDRLGTGFHIMSFGALPDDLRRAVCAMADRAEPPVQWTAISRDGGTVPGATVAVADADGGAFAKYGAEDGTVYLARPDLHVAARWRACTPDALATAFAAARMSPDTRTER